MELVVVNTVVVLFYLCVLSDDPCKIGGTGSAGGACVVFVLSVGVVVGVLVVVVVVLFLVVVIVRVGCCLQYWLQRWSLWWK